MKYFFCRVGLVFALIFCMAASGFCAEKVKVGLIYGSGGAKDVYNQMGYQGLMQAKADLAGNLEIVAREANEADLAALERLAAEKCRVIVSMGFGRGANVERLSEQYPGITFILLDDVVANPRKNLLCLRFREQEGAYLAGVAAALKSGSGKIGFIGALHEPVIERFQTGYIAGAKSVNPKIEVLSGFVGSRPIAFKNSYRAKELARGQIAAGADVIYHAAGFAGVGVIEAAAEKNILAIGTDVDQSLSCAQTQRAHILTSTLKRVDVAVCEAVKDACAGRLESGARSLGLKEGGIDYAVNKYNRALLTDIQPQLEAAKRRISGGDIKVPEKMQP